MSVTVYKRRDYAEPKLIKTVSTDAEIGGDNKVKKLKDMKFKDQNGHTIYEITGEVPVINDKIGDLEVQTKINNYTAAKQAIGKVADGLGSQLSSFGKGGASTKKRRPRRGGRRLRKKSMKRNVKHRR